MAKAIGYPVKRITGHVVSVQSDAELMNGYVTFKGDLVTGQSEIYTAKKPLTADLGTEAAYLVSAPEINYDESTYDKGQLGAFSIEAGVPARAFSMAKDDIIAISYDAVTLLSTDAVVGNYLIPANDSFKLLEAEAIGTTKFAAKILEVKTVGTLAYTGSAGSVGNQYKLIIAEVVKN